MRRIHVAVTLFVTLFAASSAAVAESQDSKRPMMMVAKEGQVQAAADVSNIIYLNRCTGGCALTVGITDDARSNTTSIPRMPPGSRVNISQFSHSEAMWQQLVSCIREVYAPYNVRVTTDDPGGAVHHMAIVAGSGSEIGLNALGVGHVNADCSPYDNGISFSFANEHSDMEDLCWTVAQETAHTYGLSHAFGCHDPMTYITRACGRKYFRNVTYECGEFQAHDRECQCSTKQNSHLRLTSVFGAGTPPTPPRVTMSLPQAGAVSSGFAVSANIDGSPRGVSKVDLMINGYKWAEIPGREFDVTSGSYQAVAPAGIPDGVIDVELRAWDDLKIGFGRASVRVTKGAPCQDESACLEGQQCDAEGRCFWEEPTGELGDTCTYDQFCKSNLCEGTCTQDCRVGVTGNCPSGFQCNPVDGTAGLCFSVADDAGGCCSTRTSRGGMFAQVLLALGVLFGVTRRRRRVG